MAKSQERENSKQRYMYLCYEYEYIYAMNYSSQPGEGSNTARATGEELLLEILCQGNKTKLPVV